MSTATPRQVISLGAGVQSSTMALMAAHGEIEPMPELAIFADTQWEPRAVYEWLDWLEAQLPFEVVRVSAGDLRAEQLTAVARGRKDEGKRFASLPYFTPSDAGRGQLRRQCTREYKIDPIERYFRRNVMGLAPRQRAPKEVQIVMWKGISTDEASRMNRSREPWMQMRYPLAMEHRMSRADCLAWMTRHGYPRPPRSACIGCPYHHDREWRFIRDETPDEWADAMAFDRAIRNAGGAQGETFLHASLRPLDEVDLDTAEERGQGTLFGEECEGMCGL